MNELRFFSNSKFGDIRVVEIEGKTYFVASDVTKALGYKNQSKAIDDHCRYVTKRYIPHPQSVSKEIEVNVIPEGDIYRLAAKSELPGADEFESWIFDEVIPSIRKTGGYTVSSKQNYQLPQSFSDALRELANKVDENDQLKLEAERNAPKVLFSEAVATSKTSILVGELAKILKQNGVDLGQNRMFEWLRKNGFLISRKGTDYNMPTQKSMGMGLFEIRETAINHPDGHNFVNKTSKVTGKGQIYFINKFLNPNSQRHERD